MDNSTPAAGAAHPCAPPTSHATGARGAVDELRDASRRRRFEKYAYGMLVMVVCYFPQEAFWGRTLGKPIARIRAVQEDGAAKRALRDLPDDQCRTALPARASR